MASLYRNTILILACAGLTNLLSLTNAATASQVALNDWRPLAADTDQVCRGEYLPPLFQPYDPNQPISIEADNGQLALSGESVFAGKVIVQDQSNRIFADSITLFRNNTTESMEWAEIRGPLLIEQPGARITGSFGKFIFKNQQVALNDSEFRLYDSHIRGSASSLSHALNTPYHLQDVSYTTCEPGNNFWQLNAATVEINQQTGMGTATHARLLIHDVPVLYSPYLTFPVGRKRKSGFLAPSYVASTSNGSEFNQPYYFNLAPNFDDTFTTSYLSKRNLLLHNEFRYLNNLHHGSVNLYLLPHDPEFASFRNATLASTANDPTDPRFKAVKRARPTRWDFQANDEAQYNIHWSTYLNYHYVSDDNLVDHLESRLGSNNTWQIEQTGRINYERANWNSSFTLQNFQILQPFDGNLNDEPYRLLPQINTEGRIPLQDTPFNLTLRTQYTRFAHAPDLLTSHKPTTGDRLVFTPGVEYRYQTPFFYFQPAIKLETRLYRLDLDAVNTNINANDQHPHLAVPVSSLKTGLIFEREGQLNKIDYGQSLETRLFYQYSPYHNQAHLPLFDTAFSPITYSSYQRPNRFIGEDRIGDSNRLGYAFISDYWNNRNGETIGGLEFGQLVYFANQKVSLCNQGIKADCIRQENPYYQQHQSNYFFAGRWHADNRNFWRLNTELDNSHLDLRTLQLQWTHELDDQHIFSIGYFRSKELAYQNTSQLNTAFAWHLTPRWNILGRWYYDITEHASLDAFAGLEYESCCFAWRIGKQRALKLSNTRRPQYDDQLFFEFVLKGLSGYGDSHAKLAESVIPGYIDRFGQFKVNRNEN